MSELLLQKREQIDNLRDRLASCSGVNRFGPDEAGTLVHVFSDLEESFRKFLGEQLPMLIDPTINGEQLEELLMDIGDEFRHILYHLHDSQFFRLLEPTHDWLALTDSASK